MNQRELKGMERLPLIGDRLSSLSIEHIADDRKADVSEVGADLMRPSCL